MTSKNSIMALRVHYANKQIFNYTSKELWHFILTSLVAGFLLSMRKWGVDEFDPVIGLGNLILYIIIFLIVYFFFITAQKWLGAAMGYEVRYEIWTYGPIIAALLTFYLVLIFPTFDFLVLLYIGTVTLKEIPELRLGKFRRGLNVKDMLIVGLAGPLFILLLILVLFQPLYFVTESSTLYFTIVIASLILFFTSWPFPKMNGINILIKSRVGWLLYFTFSLLFVLLISTLQVWAYLVAIVLAAAFVWWFRIYVSPKLLHT